MSLVEISSDVCDLQIMSEDHITKIIDKNYACLIRLHVIHLKKKKV